MKKIAYMVNFTRKGLDNHKTREKNDSLKKALTSIDCIEFAYVVMIEAKVFGQKANNSGFDLLGNLDSLC